MTARRKVRVAKVEPQQPVATLANIEAILGNGFDLPVQFVAAMFEIAPHMQIGTDYLLVQASLKLTWNYQRAVKRIVRPWKRSWDWSADDRINIAQEIIEAVWKSNEVTSYTETAIRARLLEISNQYNVEVYVELLNEPLLVIGRKRVVGAINTCRVIWDGIVLHPERQNARL